MNRISHQFQEVVKRTIDLTVAVVLLLMTWPLLLAVASLVRCRMGKPVLFCQQRPGLHGRPFNLHKFRTMRATRAPDGKLLPDADRLTRLGTILRRLSLDELPQLWNVLRGDMSLVGPRPLLMEYMARYTPEQARRHEVKPGVTGWAQINGRNAITWEEKFELDVWYVEHRSLRLDLYILLETFVKVFRQEGISSAKHSTMPEFLPSRLGGSEPARDDRRAA